MTHIERLTKEAQAIMGKRGHKLDTLHSENGYAWGHCLNCNQLIHITYRPEPMLSYSQPITPADTKRVACSAYHHKGG